MEVEDLDQKKKELESELKMLLLPRIQMMKRILSLRSGPEQVVKRPLFLQQTWPECIPGTQSERVEDGDAQLPPCRSGGFKEIIIGIQGEKVYSYLKYEMGVHRVQRVPVTEAAGVSIPLLLQWQLCLRRKRSMLKSNPMTFGLISSDPRAWGPECKHNGLGCQNNSSAYGPCSKLSG